MSSPPSYTSRDDEKEKEREQDKERTSGEGNRKGNSSSKHREDDDKRSTKSRGSRKSHRSDSHHHHHHRHHHHDEQKAEANGEGSSSSPLKSDHDRKSTKSSESHSRERRRSVHEYGDDDKKSMKSSKSSRSRERPRSYHEQGGTSPMKALSESEVDRLARSRMRRSQYGPDFLRELAKHGIPAEFEQDGLPKFRVVTGHEARSIYNDVLGEDDHHASSSQGHDLRRLEGRTPSSARDRPVVFAFPVHPPNSTLRAGRKVVDYYMTWKGKTGTHRLKGRSRKNNFLDDDFEHGFKKLAHAMDDVAKKRLSGVPKPVELQDSPVPDTPRPPITSSQSAPAAPITTTKEEAEPLARPNITSRGSNASVLSLPYLGAPGVALRSPLHLRVTNPDPSSSSGTASKRTSLLEPEPKTPTASGLGRKLSVVEEGDEPEKEKKHRRTHGHSSKRDTRSISSDSISISSSESKKKEEILIVLMDSDQEKDRKAKWALQRVKRSNSARAPVRKASTRHSPWDGPVATSNGEVHRYVPGMSDQEDEIEETSDEDSEPDDNVFPIPNRTALMALGYHHPQQYSASSPHLAPTPAPTLLSQATPAMSPAVLSPIYPASAQLYSSPHAYSTPNLPLTQAIPMPVPVTVPVGSPYVLPWPSSDYAPTPAQSIHSQLPPMDHPGTAGYTSPYVKPKQAPYLYSPAREPPLQIYATPSPKANLSRSVSGSGAGGAHIALPPPSIYVNSPYLRPESAHVLL